MWVGAHTSQQKTQMLASSSIFASRKDIRRAPLSLLHLPRRQRNPMELKRTTQMTENGKALTGITGLDAITRAGYLATGRLCQRADLELGRRAAALLSFTANQLITAARRGSFDLDALQSGSRLRVSHTLVGRVASHAKAAAA
jgi:hypothetical protein